MELRSSDFPFPFTDEHRMVRETVRELVDGQIAPRALELDETHEFPWDNFRALAGLGILGAFVPEAYGGAGMDFTSYVIAMEELARGCGSTALTLTAQASLCIAPILAMGTEEQKQRWLPVLCSGEMVGCFGLTEPQAGSDAGNCQTRAVRQNGSYILSGSKAWITNGREAGVMVATVKTDPAQGRGKGISALIVDMQAPGISVPKVEDKLGLRASSTAQVFFDQAGVPAENLLGIENDGFKTFLKTLEGGRIGIAAMSVGLAQAALERAAKYSAQRHTFGQALAAHQTIQAYIADMATQLDAARLLTYRAAFMKDAGMPFAREASMAKLFASEMAVHVCERAIQIHGGFGYVREFEVERLWRDAKLCTIGEGASEIQQLVIARSILGDATRAVG